MPAPKEHGRPRIHSPREILDAIFYVLRSGCQWRLLPHDFPRWPTVYHYFRKWCIDGTWETINRAIRERLRVRLKRNPQPSAGVLWIVSRSRVPGWAERNAVTTVQRRSKAEKAPSLLVDTEGFVLKVKVHSAKVMDWDGIKALLQRADMQFPRLKHLWVDALATGVKIGARTGWGEEAWMERGTRRAPSQTCSKGSAYEMG